MRSYNVILFIALVTFSFSNAFEFTNLAEVKELRSSSYGNSLIETISLTLQNAGSIDEVSKLLEDLLFKLNSDQEKADSDWKAAKEKLEAAIKQLEDDITALDKKISLDESDLQSYQGLAVKSQTNLDQYQAQRTSNDAALVDNEKRRRKDIDLYTVSIREHSDVINAIGEVVKELNKLVGSISGENKPAHVEEIAAETRDREQKMKKSFVQLTKDETEAMLFVEMATSADQAALIKLIGLLNDISESTKASLNADEESEANSKKAYDNLKSSLNSDNVLLDQNIKDQQKNLKTYQEKIAALTASIADNKKLRESKKQEREETIKIKNEKETQYNQDKAERSREKEVINKLKGIVKDRLNSMSKFLKSQTGAF